MQTALGILLIFAGIAGAYYVLSGKLSTATATATPQLTPGPSGEKASGETSVPTAKDIILPQQKNG